MHRPFMWYKNLCRSFVYFVTIHAFDGQTDRRTDGRTDGFTIPNTALHRMQCNINETATTRNDEGSSLSVKAYKVILSGVRN